MDCFSADCPNCGASLQVPNNMESLYCMYCGSNFIIEATQEEVLSRNHFTLAEFALSHKDYGEALFYYKMALESNPLNGRAWYGKGVCILKLNPYSYDMYQVAINCFLSAKDYLEPDILDEMKHKMADEIADYLLNYFYNLNDEFGAYRSIDSVTIPSIYIDQCYIVLASFNVIDAFEKTNINAISNKITICVHVINAVNRSMGLAKFINGKGFKKLFEELLDIEVTIMKSIDPNFKEPKICWDRPTGYHFIVYYIIYILVNYFKH
jgi:tetratricopeptide (TPR) repeat protein